MFVAVGSTRYSPVGGDPDGVPIRLLCDEIWLAAPTEPGSRLGQGGVSRGWSTVPGPSAAAGEPSRSAVARIRSRVCCMPARSTARRS
jgi:hypothetical protein